MGTMPKHPYTAIENHQPGTIGCQIHYFEEVESTQNIARNLAAEGAPHGTVVIAETQSAGRGRMGRGWHSPPGVNLYTTIILRPKIAMAEVPRLSLVAGIAAAEALEEVAPGIVQLKWPNDVWLNGRKAGGIIAEAVTDRTQQLDSVLVGIGLNLNLAADDVPPEIRERAISVLIATGRRCDRIAVANSLFTRLNIRYDESVTHGFAAVRPTLGTLLGIDRKTRDGRRCGNSRRGRRDGNRCRRRAAARNREWHAANHRGRCDVGGSL